MSKYIDKGVVSEIDKRIDLVLKEAAIVVPPINFNTLIDLEKLNCSVFTEHDLGYQEMIKALGPKLSGNSIRGALIVNQKQLFIKNERYEKRLNYTLGHELAHWCLGWHNELLFCCSEFDLSIKVRKQLEMEANYFSCRLGFLNGLFNKEMADNPLRISVIQSLSDKYNMSVEATLRSAVEHEHRACAFIVMDYKKTEGGYEFIKKYNIESKSFREMMGNNFVFKEKFESNHIMTQLMNDPKLSDKKIMNYEILLKSKDNKEVKAELDIWYHQYGAIALVVIK